MEDYKRQIIRLAITSRNSETYYAPGHTMIADRRVTTIVEHDNHYGVLDINGFILAEVSKD